MTVYFDKKRKAWKFDFWRDKRHHFGYCVHPDGRRAANKSEARRIEDGHKAAADNRPGARIGTPVGYTMAQAAVAYLGTLEGRANHRDAKRHVEELLRSKWFRADRLVTEISDQDVLDYISWSKKRPTRVWIGGPVSRQAIEDRLAPGANGGPPLDDEPVEKTGAKRRADSTTNRHLGTLRSIFKLAHKMRDAQTKRRLLPDPPAVPALKEPERVPRPVPDAVLEAVAPHAERHLLKALWLIRATGMRLDEALTARASRVDFDQAIYWLPAEATKSKRDEAMPLPETALPVLQVLVDEARAAGRDELVLYTPPAPRNCPPGKEPAARPVKSIRRAWSTAQRQAGVERPYRVHDIRASFITAVSLVASDKVTQSLARHVSAATTARYILVVDPVRRAAVEAASMPKLAALGGAAEGSGPNPESQSRPGRQQKPKLNLLK